MVGFLNHEDNEEETSNLPSNKLKSTVDPSWSDSFDFLDQFVPEIDDLFIPGNASFLDLDSIKDWLQEMEDPVVKLEPGVAEALSEPAPCSGGDVLVKGSSGMDNACSVKTELVDGIDGSGELLREESEGLEDSAVEKGNGGEKLGSLDSVVEEGLGKVSLVDGVELNPVLDSVVVKEDDESSGFESESESSDSSAASSASSSSSSGENDDDVVDEGENKGVSKEVVCEVEEELEEGEIMETDADKVIHSSSEDDDDKDIFNAEFLMDDDDDEDGPIGGVKEPIKSKNELKDLPPVPPVDVTLQPSHQMLPVGVVSSVLGAQVIVEGGEKHNPLSEGSILWITERRSPLGRVDEIFGPVKNPYYIVRYNSESEVPEGMHEGILVSFVPEFVDHVLNNQNLYQKGYDASGDNDEEELDEAEFSDDEKEAEYRRMMKMSKRGNNTDMKLGGNKRSGKNFRRKEMHSSNYHQSNSMQGKDSPPVQARNMQNQQGSESPVRHPTDHSNQPGSSRFSPAYPGGPGLMPGRPQHNGPPPSGMPFQMQNGEFGNGFQMPWIQQQQHLQQLPMMNSGPPFQQAFNPAGQTPNNMVPSNTAMGPPFSPMPAGGMLPNAFNQVPFSMALQAQLAQLSMLSGLLAGQGNMQHLPPGLHQNAEALPPQFNPGPGPSHHQGGAGSNNMQQHRSPSFQQSGEALPPQFNQGPGPSHHQGGAGSNNMQQRHRPPSFQQSGEVPPPQFNQGPGSAHQGGRPPFQRRGGGRSGGRGRGGRRGGGGHHFQSR